MPFHGLVPAIQQAILLGFERIIVPPIDISFLGEINSIEFVTIHSLSDLIAYLRGQQTLGLPQQSLITLNETSKADETVIVSFGYQVLLKFRQLNIEHRTVRVQQDPLTSFVA